ncbi:MAG: hypothetical protein ACRC9Y_09995 [Aeromonas veronii]
MAFKEVMFTIGSSYYTGDYLKPIHENSPLPVDLVPPFKARLVDTNEEVLVTSYTSEAGGGHGEGRWSVNRYKITNLETLKYVDESAKLKIRFEVKK